MTVLVAGVGNPDRGDDGVGPAVARYVGALGLPGVVVAAPVDPVDLLGDRLAADVLVVVDAVRSGRSPGSVVMREIDAGALPSWTGSGGTHALGLDTAIELMHVLGRLPGRVVLVGVGAGELATGAPLSAAVRAAVPVAARAVVEVVSQSRGGGT